MRKLWLGLEFKDFYDGFDEDVLLALVSKKTIKADKNLGYRSFLKLFWTSEIYSFGRCFREWLNWPWYLPLPFYSDHGVCFTGTLAPHEINNKSMYHLTWELDRYSSISVGAPKSIIRVPHPWIHHRKAQNYKLKPNAKGTLVFYSHSVVGIDETDYNLEEYLSLLRSLPPEYFPMVFCVHMHDINKGVHQRLRQYGVKVVTLGNTSSQFFVDRFYDLATHFKFATSNTGGSEAYYCSELGMKYFILGAPPVYINHSHPQNMKGIQKPRDSVEAESLKKKNYYFRRFPPNDKKELAGYIEKVLALDVNSDLARGEVNEFLKAELLRLAPFLLFRTFRSLISKTISFIKKV